MAYNMHVLHTVQLNANLMTAHRLQVENAQVSSHTRAGKDQGVRHGFTPTGQPAGMKLWHPFVLQTSLMPLYSPLY